MSELNAGQIIDEATRLAGKSDDDAMDLVPMHRWWWRYSQNLDSMLRHMLLDHDQMHAVPAPGQEELSCMGCKWFDDYPCDNSNPCLSCIRRKLPRDNYLPSAPAPEKGEAAEPLPLLPLLRDVEEALIDLGACDNPYCIDCPRVLPRIRAAIREHAAGTEPAGRIR